MNQPRGEDELRAAFTAKAAEAPRAEDVLRAVRREVYQPPARRRWLAPASPRWSSRRSASRSGSAVPRQQHQREEGGRCCGERRQRTRRGIGRHRSSGGEPGRLRVPSR